jgi:hypothetical protein
LLSFFSFLLTLLILFVLFELLKLNLFSLVLKLCFVDLSPLRSVVSSDFFLTEQILVFIDRSLSALLAVEVFLIYLYLLEGDEYELLVNLVLFPFY